MHLEREVPVGRAAPAQCRPRPPAVFKADDHGFVPTVRAGLAVDREVAVDHTAVLDDLDPVHHVPAANAGADFTLAGEGGLLAHHRAVHRKVDFDPIAGDGVSASVPQRVEDCVAGEFASLDHCQAFAVAARIAEMVVGARHDA